jgi:hypothetical protein
MGNNYPKEVRELFAEERRVTKLWQQTGTPSDKTGLNNLSLQLKREIQEVKNESINSNLTELTNEEETGYSLWKATKRMKRPVVHITPIRKEDSSWAKMMNKKLNYLQTTWNKFLSLTSNKAGMKTNWSCQRKMKRFHRCRRKK